MIKSTKSHIRGRSSLLYISSRVHELVARAMRGECVRQRAKLKSTMSYSPQPHTTTRANTSHEKAEQIRARIASTPAEKRWAGVDGVCALTGRWENFLFCLLVALWFYLVGVCATLSRRYETTLRIKRKYPVFAKIYKLKNIGSIIKVGVTRDKRRKKAGVVDSCFCYAVVRICFVIFLS